MGDRTPTTAAGRAAMRGIIGGSLALWRDEPDAIADLILAIEAEARETADYECLECGGRAEAHAPLDVERVARIFHDRLDQSVLGHAGPVCQPCRQNAKAFVREYAALEEPTDD